MRSAERKAFLDAALSYTEQAPQWPIFPVHPVSKHPLIKTGADHAENASTDPEQIERWILQDFPGCGIGMPTGAVSGVVVIDADRKHNGETLLAELEDALCPLPSDRIARTRSGGLHVYLVHPGNGIRVKSTAGATGPLGKLLCGRPGVDVRADGGIVVLSPSLGYRWLRDEDDRLPPLPPLWLAAIQGAGEPSPRLRRATTMRTDGDTVGDMLAKMSPITEGARNGMLYRIGVRLRHDGRTEDEILDGLERINAALVTPSLPDREVQKIARSAARETR